MTLDELLALLPDNTTGAIDAADLRTIVTELYGQGLEVQGTDTWENIQATTPTEGDLWVLSEDEPGIGVAGDGLTWDGIEWVNVGPILGPPGPPGAPGDDAQWTALTQAEYDALPVKDPNTLYVIVP